MTRFSSSSVLLVIAVIGCSQGRLPFICKIRKVNCALRPSSVCCQHSSTSTTTSSSATTSSTDSPPGPATVRPGREQEEETVQPELLQLPSDIHEVVVLPDTGELVQETSTTSTSTTNAATSSIKAKPGKTAPRFCLKIKFNCALLASHPCCRLPLPPAPATQQTKPEFLQSRQPRKQAELSTGAVTNASPTVTKVSTVAGEEEETNDAESKAEKKPVKKREKKSFLKKSLFNANRKASGVCRIVSCSRNKRHYCCRNKIAETKTKTSKPNKKQTTITTTTTTKTTKTINTSTTTTTSVPTTVTWTETNETTETTENFTPTEATTVLDSMRSSSEMSTEVGSTELTPRTEQWEVATTAEKEVEEMVTVVSLRQSESYEETRVVNTEQPQEETDLLEQGGEESQRVVAVYPVYIPDISNALSGPAGPRDEDVGREPRLLENCTDCLNLPHQACCSPHSAQKRHSTELQDLARVTATITRIVKSISWV